MSRIGRLPIEVPEKVQITIKDTNVVVKGPNGQLENTFEPQLVIKQEGAQVNVSLNDDKYKNLWGLTRTLIDNMVVGVTKGFEKALEFNGVGYKATVKGDTLVLNLGYSHPIDYKLPEGIKAAVKGNTITVSGISKELVGFSAAKIRSFRPPEPYKGKGIKYADETIIRKAGKAGGKGK